MSLLRAICQVRYYFFVASCAVWKKYGNTKCRKNCDYWRSRSSFQYRWIQYGRYRSMRVHLKWRNEGKPSEHLNTSTKTNVWYLLSVKNLSPKWGTVLQYSKVTKYESQFFFFYQYNSELWKHQTRFESTMRWDAGDKI